MNYTKKAVHGAGNIFAMSMLASALAYLTRIILGKNLSPEDFGLFYAVFTFLVFLLFFRDLGFSQALMKHIAEFNVHQQFGKIKSAIMITFYFQFIGSIIFAIVIYLLAPYLALHYFKNQEATTILRILIIYIFGSMLFIISKDTLLGLQRTALFSLGEFLKNGFVFLLVLLFFYLNKGVYAPVYAFALVCFLLFAIYFPLLLREYSLFKYKTEQFPQVAKKIIWFAVPVFATAVGSKIIGYVDTLMLTYFRSLTEVGIYNAVLPTSLLLLYFGTSIASVVLPMASELWTRGDTKRLVRGIETIYNYLFVGLVPFFGILFVFAPFILQTFFGSEYLTGVLAMRILLVGSFVFTLALVNHNLFTALGKPQLVTKIIFLAAAVNAGLNVILIPWLGITGAGISTTASYLVAFIVSLWKMNNCLEITIPWKKWGSLLLVGIIFMLLLYKIPLLLSLNYWLELALAIVIAGMIYLLLLYCFGVINLDEIKSHYKLVRWKETK